MKVLSGDTCLPNFLKTLCIVEYSVVGYTHCGIFWSKIHALWNILKQDTRTLQYPLAGNTHCGIFWSRMQHILKYSGTCYAKYGRILCNAEYAMWNNLEPTFCQILWN